MKKIVIIHGLGGLKEMYFPHLAQTCKNLGLLIYMPNLGSYHDVEGIDYQKWNKRFKDNLPFKLDKETIVVANSLGTQFAVKYFAENELEIKAYISVAGAYKITEMRATAPERVLNAKWVTAKFEPSESEFEKFKSLKFQKYSYFSDNDRFFELENLEKYSLAIGSEQLFIPNRYHFDKLDYCNTFITEFVELEELIKSLI